MGVLEYGEWREVRSPFRHFQASNVLAAESYRVIALEFQRVLDATEGRITGGPRFGKPAANYDARMLPITEENMEHFPPFFSDGWLRSLSDLVRIPFVPRIDGALHSSPPNSRSGWMHTDFCSGWFDESRNESPAFLFPDRSRCHYFEGAAKVAGAKPTEYVRAATLIFYLCNDDWAPGDGGETEFYGSRKDSQNTRKLLIPPVNNSLILFECSPHSYHRFITNPGRTRNSLILWLHCEVDFVEKRWGSSVLRRKGNNQ